MEKVFRPIIEEVKQNKENTTKTLIFCQNQKLSGPVLSCPDQHDQFPELGFL